MRRNVTLLLLMLTVLSPVWGRTVKWAISPKYDRLELYCDGVYKYHQGHQCGLITTTGEVIEESIADSISPVDVNGMALLLTVNGKLKGLYNARMRRVIPLSEDYAVNMRDAFFSEGFMPVKKGDKWGYIDTEGNLAIKCKYFKALPFSEGKAAVTLKDKRVMYINADDEIALRTSFNNNELNYASPFVGGVAYIGFNGNYALIDGYGKVKKKFNRNELPNNIPGPLPQYQELRQPTSKIDPNQSGGKWGYSDILPAQLEEARPFCDDLAIVRSGGKWGVLQLVNGDFGLSNDDKPITVKNNKTQDYELRLWLPSGLEDTSSMAFKLDKGDKEMKLVKPSSIEHGVAVFKFTPKVEGKAENCSLGLEVFADGLTLYSNTSNIKVHRIVPPPPPTVDPPNTGGGEKPKKNIGTISGNISTSGRADNGGYQRITGKVSNTTDKSVTVALKVGKDQSKSVNVAPGRTGTVEVSVKVTKNSSCKAELSAGGKSIATKTIKLVPFQ